MASLNFDIRNEVIGFVSPNMAKILRGLKHVNFSIFSTCKTLEI